MSKKLIIFFVSILCLAGCKQNNWLDWKAQNDLWLENNKTQTGVKVTDSGLQYRVIADPGVENNETSPNPTSTIVCDYVVKLINGYQVDGGNAVSLSLASTIPGFQEGCHLIHNHGDIELFIPAYLGYDYTKYQSGEYDSAEGYGSEGTQIYIPPYSTLIYTVHLCGISN